MKLCRVICSGISLVIALAALILGVLTIISFDGYVDNINKMIYQHLLLEEGSEMTKNFEFPPVQPMLEVYFFNVTNPKEYLDGEKPVLNEMGPYVYSQHWERDNLTFNGNGTVSSALKKIFTFQRSLSSGSESDMITVVDVPTVTAVWQVRHTPRFMQLIFSSMLEVLEKGPFSTHNVSELMWGYEDPLIKMAKDIMPPESRPPNDIFGFFYGINNTAKTLMTQYIATAEDMSKYMQVESVNGESMMKWWEGDACNKVKGSDGSGWGPPLNRARKLFLFNDGMCRALPLEYKKDVTKYGIDGYRFAPPDNVFDPPSMNPENACYCKDEFTCDGRGVFNISSCKFGSPTMLSWPHFYNADPKYGEEFDGLSPDQEKHEFFIDLIPRTGLPLQAKGRMQVNMMVTNVTEIKPITGLRPMLFPVLWFQDGVPEMPSDTQTQLYISAYLPELMKTTILSFSFIVGVLFLSLFMLTIFLCVRNNYCGKSGEVNIHKDAKNGTLNSYGHDNRGMEKE